jgi:hypothetical protein
VKRATLIATLAALLLITLAPPAVGQAPPREHRRSRSKVLAIVGALVGGALGVGFVAAARQKGDGGCIKVPCIVIASTAGGALFGYLIGREFDQNYIVRYRGVPPLRLPNITADLIGDPVEVAVNDSTVAVAGSAGVQLFRAADHLVAYGTRAKGVRGIDHVDLAPNTGWLTLGSPTGLYLYPPQRGPGALIRGGDVTAIAASPSRVFFGVESRLEVAPLSADSARDWSGVTLDTPARDLKLDWARDLLWAVTDKELVAFHVRGDSLTRIGGAPLEPGARRLALSENMAAVALGDRGVWLFDVSDPAQPRRVASWTTARFVYDVSLDHSRLFVAAGPEGVYVVSVAHPAAPQTVGLARSLGFASALVSQDGYTYVLDRRTNSLRRIRSDF